jgi:hypothetical protein
MPTHGKRYLLSFAKEGEETANQIMRLLAKL